MNTHLFFFLADATELFAGGLGIVGLLIFAFLVVLSIVWLLFPFLMLGAISKLREQTDVVISLQRALLAHAAAQQAAAERTGDLLGTQTEIAAAHGAGAQRVRDEIAAHLQKIGTSSEYTNSLLQWIGEQKAATPQA